MEKRELSRVVFNEEAIITYKGLEVEGTVLNLSLKGMFFKTKQKIGLNENVEIKVFLTGSTSKLAISMNGIVERVDKNGIGLQFTEIDLDSFIHLRNVLEYNKGESKEIMEEFYKFIKKRKK